VSRRSSKFLLAKSKLPSLRAGKLTVFHCRSSSELLPNAMSAISNSYFSAVQKL